MRYAEVCVNSPIAQRRTFSYSIPQHLNVRPGQAVWVPFGEKTIQGIVCELTDFPEVEETRDIEGIIETAPLLSAERIALARWISRHYLSPLFDAVALMLPPGFERKPLTFLSALELDDGSALSSLNEEDAEVYGYIYKEKKVGQKDLEKTFGQRKARRTVLGLMRAGLVSRVYELEPVKAKPKVTAFIRLAVGTEQVREEAEKMRGRASRRAALLTYLVERAEPVLLSEALRDVGGVRDTANALVERGLAAIEDIEVRRDPLAAHSVNVSFPLTLNPDQQAAFDEICSCMSRPAPGVFVLRGVTGSGKTEVYLQALDEAIKRGKKGIVLVPEISLTPQTVERFSSRFPGRVAVLHSQLTLGEQYDEWHRIFRGEADVVIGPRSAIFAPQPDLGLIILDEEHEWTYKQDMSPRYHARDVAVKLAELSGARLVLGSASPDVESYYRAETGEYRLLLMPERVTPAPNTPLPAVEIVDLREELKSGNRSMFSRSLAQAIEEALNGKEQVMLFLNRRGGATFIQCRDCGEVISCRRCHTPLSYHMDENLLVCHHCNYRRQVPKICPACGSRRIRFLGAGTQKLEEEAHKAFPRARLLRWDSDTTRARDSHREILEKFRNHQADILIGTQMITKGLDLPRVTLVGVVSADTSLHLPDFRAGERTFQMLSQVAGRAGRGPLGGRVIIQTYSPDNYAVQAAALHDYDLFYRQEIGYRRRLNNPPFSELAGLTYSHKTDAFCQREAQRMRQRLAEEIAARGISGIDIIGPAPAFIHRLRGRYRWQIILRGRDLPAFLNEIPFPQAWAIDIDPLGL